MPGRAIQRQLTRPLTRCLSRGWHNDPVLLVGGVYPSLDLDFENNRYAGNLSPIGINDGGNLSYTRTGIKGQINIDGSVTLQPANTPSIGYDYSDTLKTIAINTSINNLLPVPMDFSDAAWSKSNFTDSGSTETAPDGTTIPIWNFENGYVFDEATIVSGSYYTNSIWIKANKTATLGLRKGGAGATGDDESIVVGTEWQRFSATSLSATTTGRLLLDSRTVNGYGATGLQVALWGPMMDKYPTLRPFTPDICGADILKYENFDGIYTADGTFYVDYITNYIGTDAGRILFSAYDSANEYSKRIFAEGFSSGEIKYNVVNSSSQASFLVSRLADTEYQDALAYKTNNFALYTNGAEIGTDYSGTIPTDIDTLSIGAQNTGFQFNGGISEFRFYPSSFL